MTSFLLYKIVIDYVDPVVRDGSNNHEHTELVYTGDEIGLRQMMLDLHLVNTEFQRDFIPVECLSYFTSRYGYILTTKEA